MEKQSYHIIIIYFSTTILPVLFTALLSDLLPVNESQLLIYLNLLCMLIALTVILCKLNIKFNMINQLFKSNLKPILMWCIVGIVLSILIQSLMIQVENYVFNIDKHDTGNFNTIKLIKMNWIALISPIILAPILEEIVFRKIIFKWIHFKTNFIIASIGSSILFALLHFNFTHIGTYTLIGMLLSFLYVKTNRLIVPIVVHVALNTLPILMIAMN